MQNYGQIIQIKYPGAVADVNFSVVLMVDPELEQQGGFDDEDNYIPPDNSGVPTIAVITMWELPEPQPTLAELDAYAASPEYVMGLAAVLKAEAVAKVQVWANKKLVEQKVIVPEFYYVAMLANVAIKLSEWHLLGNPAVPDPVQFVTTYAETKAYREAHAGLADAEASMTEAQLLALQENTRSGMQLALAEVVYKRRLALEKIKLAQPGEGLAAELAAVLVEIGWS